MRTATIAAASILLAAAIPAPIAGSSPWSSSAHLGRVTPSARKDDKFKKGGR